MGRRDRLISTSILRAIFRTGSEPEPADEEARPGLFARILAFFAIFQLALSRYRAKVFRKLRNQIWQIEEEEYTESFRSPSKSKRTDLVAIGDLGYSGSVREVLRRFVCDTDCVRRSSLRRTRSTSSNRYRVHSSNLSSATVCSAPMSNTWS